MSLACIPSGFTNLVDFQGHVVDNSDGFLNPSNPIIGQFFAPGDSNQIVCTVLILPSNEWAYP